MSELTEECKEEVGQGAVYPQEHPLMIAWNGYKKTEIFLNMLAHESCPERIEGFLWAGFEAGWIADGEYSRWGEVIWNHQEGT